MRNETERLAYTVNRVLCLSPEQVEITRRSGSRIFISTIGENLLDTILLQTQRSMDNYIESAARAITLAELTPYNSDAIALKPSFNPNTADGLFQSYIQANAWLKDENGELYDLILELEPQGYENLQSLGFQTMNANMIDGFGDNPLIFKAGIEELGPEMNLDGVAERILSSKPADDEDQSTGGQGRVKSSNDGRLKQNREPQLQSARLGQARDTDDQYTRQHGKPGRVRNPTLDFRRKDLRTLAAATLSGSSISAGR